MAGGMEADNTLAPGGPWFWDQESDDNHFWAQALVDFGLLDGEAASGFSESLQESVVEDDGQFYDCNFGVQDAQANQGDAVLWDADFGAQDDRLGKLEGESKGYQFLEEWLATDTTSGIGDGFLPAPVTETKPLDAQSESHGHLAGVQLVEEEAAAQVALESKHAPDLKSISSPGTPEEATTRGRKRIRETVDSPESCESPDPESLVVNFKDARSLSGGESSNGRSRSTSSSRVMKSVSTPEGDDDSRRLLRLEKNRESASQSRARKKSYVKELEVKCRMLEAHVAQLQRVMGVTSMENAALKDELVRVKKPKDGVKSGVAEPAVLESNSLPLEFLPRRSCHYPMGQPCSTGGRSRGFLLALLQLLVLAVASGPSVSQASRPQPLRDEHGFSGGFWRYPDPVVGAALEDACGYGLAAGHSSWRKKKRQRRFDCHDMSGNCPLQWRLHRRKRVGSRRRVKRLRSSRIL